MITIFLICMIKSCVVLVIFNNLTFYNQLTVSLN
jgi:hypothetical protein